jgi:hypothetical protein
MENNGEDIRRLKTPCKDEINIENKGEYFEWTCSKCNWGARGYDKDAITTISKRHNKLGCREFASEVESRGLRID